MKHDIGIGNHSGMIHLLKLLRFIEKDCQSFTIRFAHLLRCYVSHENILRNHHLRTTAITSPTHPVHQFPFITEPTPFRRVIGCHWLSSKGPPPGKTAGGAERAEHVRRRHCPQHPGASGAKASEIAPPKALPKRADQSGQGGLHFESA